RLEAIKIDRTVRCGCDARIWLNRWIASGARESELVRNQMPVRIQKTVGRAIVSVQSEEFRCAANLCAHLLVALRGVSDAVAAPLVRRQYPVESVTRACLNHAVEVCA